MVVDEELKMMCDICHEGGQVLGPFLKPMTHLVHTEYLLAGRTSSTSATCCGHDVRRHRHRCAGGERVPADPASTSRRVGATTPARSRCIGRDERRRTDRGLPIVIRTADVVPTAR